MPNQKEIKLKIVGKTVFTTIAGKKLSAILEKDAKDKLKANIEKYYNNPSDFWLQRIIKAFTTKEIVNKDKYEAKKAKREVKAIKELQGKSKQTVKAQAKIVEVLTDEEMITKLTADPDKQKKIKNILAALAVEEVKAQPTPAYGARRPGEY